MYTQLLQPAADLAAALQATQQQQPEQQLADAVQLARAAATRGCANLRCAELEGAGKSLPCGACRTSRYCCRACSVADKTVCAVLAAERQQQVAGEGRQSADDAQHLRHSNKLQTWYLFFHRVSL